MKTFIKIQKDNVSAITINNKIVNLKKGDLLVIKDNYKNTFHKGQVIDNCYFNHVNITNILLIKQLSLKANDSDTDFGDYSIYNEIEYRDQKLNTLLR